MKQLSVLALATLLAAACASAPPSQTAEASAVQAGPAPAGAAGSDAAPAMLVAGGAAIAQPTPVCQPEVVDDRAKLDPNCITVVEDLAKRNGRYAATGREKRELRSLCENQWLPRCRHKY